MSSFTAPFNKKEQRPQNNADAAL